MYNVTKETLTMSMTTKPNGGMMMINNEVLVDANDASAATPCLSKITSEPKYLDIQSKERN